MSGIDFLIYCDDPSHTAVAFGPVITDPNLVLPENVYVVDEFNRDTILGDDDYVWISKSYGYVRDQRRWTWDGSRTIVDDGTVLPPDNYQTKAQQRLTSHGRTRRNWGKRCPASASPAAWSPLSGPAREAAIDRSRPFAADSQVQ